VSVPAPDSKELADIAISTADTLNRLLGWNHALPCCLLNKGQRQPRARFDTVLKALEMGARAQTGAAH